MDIALIICISIPLMGLGGFLTLLYAVLKGRI